MPNTLQDFLALVTPKASKNLAAAYERIPDDKKNWKPSETARPAVDLIAEVAILNGYTADLILSRTWTMNDFSIYTNYKNEVCGWEAEKIKALLEENTRRVVDAVKATPDADLSLDIAMPWETQSLAEVCSYPYWNASYHEGQLNYLASILGCLD